MFALIRTLIENDASWTEENRCHLYGTFLGFHAYYICFNFIRRRSFDS